MTSHFVVAGSRNLVVQLPARRPADVSRNGLCYGNIEHTQSNHRGAGGPEPHGDAAIVADLVVLGAVVKINWKQTCL